MTGLALAGGGARGAYQIGVWKALDELGIEINIVCGTSVGALNGAMFAQGKYKEAYYMWSNMSMTTVFEGDTETFNQIDKIAKDGLKNTSLDLLKAMYNHVTKNRGFNIDPLRKQIEDHLDIDTLRNSDIEYGLVTVDVTNRKTHRIFASDIEDENLKYYIMGSALVPGFAQDKSSPIKFVDGGVIDNLPIKMIRDKGVKDIIAVNLSDKRKPYLEGVNITYIKPSESLGNFLYFEKEKSIRHINLGYLDALKVYNKLSGINYFFENTPSELDCLNMISEIPPSMVDELCLFLNIQPKYDTRYLLEYILPKLSKKLGISEKSSYNDLMYGLVEHLLNKGNFERVMKYNFYEALSLVLENEYQDDSSVLVQKLLSEIKKGKV